jgi:hypothetical protein
MNPEDLVTGFQFEDEVMTARGSKHRRQVSEIEIPNTERRRESPIRADEVSF